jgi:hypothetical protein
MDANGAERYFPWDVLELDPTSDQRAIKRAYARLLRQNNPEDDPKGFQRLREAFEHAQQEAKWLELEPPNEDKPPDEDAAEREALQRVSDELGAAWEQTQAEEGERAARERAVLRVVPAEPEPSSHADALTENALRVEPAAERDPPSENPAPPEPALRVEPAQEPDSAAQPELWQGPEGPVTIDHAFEIAEAMAEADPFEALCAAAEQILSDRDAAAMGSSWEELLHGIDRAGIDSRRVFGHWLFNRLYEFDKSRPWGNPAFHGIPREVWLTLDRQFGWAADEIKLAAHHSDEAIVSVMGAVRRARGEKAEIARDGGRSDIGAPPADQPGKTPWWVWWLVIWVIIALIRLFTK